MEHVILVNSSDFWDKHKEITREVVREELTREVAPKKDFEDILIIEEVCQLLKKSKQTIYNWMEAGIIKGHYINESLFFLRSEIIALLKSDKKETKNKKQ